MRTPKEILIATKPYAVESRWQSWFHLWVAALAYAVCFLTIAIGAWLPFQIAASVVSGLLIVRMFIIYHDYMHNAILRRSYLASGLMHLYGLLVLSPPSVWTHSHNHHHKHNSRQGGTNVGSFPIVSVAEYRKMNFKNRLAYLASRHPATIFGGYLTVFLFGMCVRTFISNPKKHFDGGIAIAIHACILGLFAMWGWQPLVLIVIVPLTIACGLGSYLFYAQHNFPTCRLNRRKEWTYIDAALVSSSYIRMGRVMSWFTGNVGYHHVHHLNAKIPFYRLPEAMGEIKELQSPGLSSLSPKDIWACLRLKLWDEDLGRLVSFKDATGLRTPEYS